MSVLSTCCLIAGVALPNPDITGHWEGSLVCRERAYAVCLDIVEADGVEHATIDLPEYLIYGCPAEIQTERDEVVLRPALIDGTVRGSFVADGFVGMASIIVPESRVTLERRSTVPIVIGHEDIRVRSGDAELVGTLVTPPGDGPFPVVVWTHGSGPDTRETFYYHGRAHLLAQNGVAGFIYDKRGAGKSTGRDAWKLDVLVADAIAVVEAVAAHPDIDGNRVGIAGFSQGGWVVPDVAGQCPDVDFVVVGATPGITVGEQNAFAAKNALESAEYDADDAAAASELLMLLYRFYQSGLDRDVVAAALDAASTEEWYREPVIQGMLFLPGGELPRGIHPYWKPFAPDPTEIWRGVKTPVLSMWGALDRQVPAERSRDVLREALSAAGNTDVSLVVFPDAGHGFWIVREEEPWDWPRQTPACAATMVEWILEHTQGHRE